MRNRVDLGFHRLGHVMALEFKAGAVREMRDVAASTRGEVVHTDHLVTIVQQSFTEVGANEAGSARDEYSHLRSPAGESTRRTTGSVTARPASRVATARAVRIHRILRVRS